MIGGKEAPMGRSLMILALALAAPAAAGQGGTPRDADFRIADIQVRLLYEASGRPSGDISADPDFAAWNLPIGEGSAKEPANDLLVTVVVAGPGEHNATAPLVITARNAKGKTLATRRISAPLLGSTTHRSLALYEVGCAGTLTLTATLGKARRTETIDLACGE